MEYLNRFLEAAPLLPVLGMLLTGMLQCFAGYRLLKFWISLSGFAVGLFMGYAVSSMLLENTEGKSYIPFVIALAAGILCGFLAHKAYLAGVFLFCGIMAFTLAAAYPFPETEGWEIAAFVIRVAVFLIAGFAGMKFAKPAVILISSFAGASSAMRALPSFVPALTAERDLQFICLAVLTAAGILIQSISSRGR